MDDRALVFLLILRYLGKPKGLVPRVVDVVGLVVTAVLLRKWGNTAVNVIVVTQVSGAVLGKVGDWVEFGMAWIIGRMFLSGWRGEVTAKDVVLFLFGR